MRSVLRLRLNIHEYISLATLAGTIGLAMSSERCNYFISLGQGVTSHRQERTKNYAQTHYRSNLCHFNSCPLRLWQKQSYPFVSNDEFFSAEFPSEPLEITFGPETTKTDQNTLHLFKERMRGFRFGMLIWLEAIGLQGHLILVLDHARDDTLTREGKDATLLSETSLEVAGFRAREIRVKHKYKYINLVQTMRIVVINQRRFKIIVEVVSETFDVSEAHRFFASFKILTNQLKNA